jgi:hypothetical protein
MIEQDDGRVAGSIDRARVAELLAGTDDEELRVYYRDLLGESEEGQAVDEPADSDPGLDAEEVIEPHSEPEPKPSMALSKDELVELARAAGIDPEGKTKAELVVALGGEA